MCREYYRSRTSRVTGDWHALLQFISAACSRRRYFAQSGWSASRKSAGQRRLILSADTGIAHAPIDQTTVYNAALSTLSDDW